MTYDTINDAVTRAGGAGALLAGRYRIVRQLGQGGMGSVWLAEDTQLDDKPFAVKMLPSILVSNKRAYRQLKDEALVAMQLVHPNIVQVRAFEENDGNPFLVMDYVDGQTLDDYLAEKGTLTEDEVIRVLRPVAAALDYAHAKGVIHRDVKPGNVMVAKDGTSCILDFGIAREIQETMTRVTGKLSSGTLLYMSPEQLMGESPKPAQDVYSFAAMAYECLKGAPPFVRGAIEDQIKNKQPEPLTGGTQLVASVMAGLAKKSEDRPATCAAVLRGNGALAASLNPQQPGGPRSVAVLKGLIAAALLAALVSGGWWLATKTTKTTETTKAAGTHLNAASDLLETANSLFGQDMSFAAAAQKYAAAARQFDLCVDEAKAEAERRAKLQHEEVQRKVEEEAKRGEVEKQAKERELARQNEEIDRKKTEEERSASSGSSSEIQVLCSLPFDQDPNYERCTDVDFAPVYFPKDTGRSPKIYAVAQHLLHNPDRVVIVTGHCDEGVSNEFGLSVGEQYACIICDGLVLAGIDNKRIQTRSYGNEKLAVKGDNERNNRGEFEIFKFKTRQQYENSVEFKTVTISSKVHSMDKYSSDEDFAELSPTDVMYLLFQASAQNDVTLASKVACTETFKLLTEEQLKNDYQQFRPENLRDGAR